MEEDLPSEQAVPGSPPQSENESPLRSHLSFVFIITVTHLPIDVTWPRFDRIRLLYFTSSLSWVGGLNRGFQVRDLEGGG